MSNLHPTALVDPRAEIHETAAVGPYAVIEGRVALGANCRVGPHCHLLEGTVLGEDNRLHAGVVLGDAPQDLAYRGASTGLRIGRGNTFREHVTVHRGTQEGTFTEIGDDNTFMAHCHVGHNSRVGCHAILANGVLLGGYVEIQDRAFLGGGAVVHQFCRIGTLAILRGLARISKDVPPYCMAVENNELVGLNAVGMKRTGFTLEQRAALKKAYATLFLSEHNLSQAIAEIERASQTAEVEGLIRFLRESSRGVARARRRPTIAPDE
ncbi:MAG: acyl-ACP--UDP-N-acetylglucosamine O-acyltransferase [Verrucomicrobiae bacterium]|nr:acyl-ACP--UDP-N-acetylglucosamine O-acyltransferase [Verrucomicrobiae bacterium]